MTTPSISIIVPVYNTQAYLGLLLSSIIQQTETSLEIIAIDDGSSDDSAAILEALAAQDQRLVLLHQANRGLSIARNVALAHARGRWIAFADSDDWLAPELLATWLQQAEALQLDLLVGNAFRFVGQPDRQTAQPMFHQQPWGEVVSGAEWINRSSTREWPHPVWLKLIRRDLLLRSGAHFAEGIVHEDILWTLQVSLAAQRIGFVQAPLYGYRLNPLSVTCDQSAAAIRRRVRSYLFIVPQFAAVARRTPDRRLRKTLLRMAHDEGTKCLALLRRSLRDPKTRGELAREVLASELLRVTFQGATTGRELWRALRGLVCCLWYAATTCDVGQRRPVADS